MMAAADVVESLEQTGLSPESLFFAYWLCRLSEVVYHEEPDAAIHGIANYLFGGLDQFDHQPKQGIVPGVAMGSKGDTFAVCFAGTQSPAHLVGQIRSWAGSAAYFDTGIDVAAANLSVAGIVENRMRAMGYKSSRRVLIGGHSYGGACAIVLALLLRHYGYGGELETHTFGSPKPLHSPFRFPLSCGKVFRWMNLVDIVPTIPPRSQDAPFLDKLTLGVIGDPKGLWFTTGTGIVLQPEGHAFISDYSPLAVDSHSSGLADWLLQAQGTQTQEHWLPPYYIRIQELTARCQKKWDELRNENKLAVLGDVSPTSKLRVQLEGPAPVDPHPVMTLDLRVVRLDLSKATNVVPAVAIAAAPLVVPGEPGKRRRGKRGRVS